MVSEAASAYNTSRMRCSAYQRLRELLPLVALQLEDTRFLQCVENDAGAAMNGVLGCRVVDGRGGAIVVDVFEERVVGRILRLLVELLREAERAIGWRYLERLIRQSLGSSGDRWVRQLHVVAWVHGGIPKLTRIEWLERDVVLNCVCPHCNSYTLAHPWRPCVRERFSGANSFRPSFQRRHIARCLHVTARGHMYATCDGSSRVPHCTVSGEYLST